MTFGTVVILLTDTDESDQLTLYKTSMQNVMDETKASEEFTTQQLYKAGSAVAFSVGTPHALKGGDDRPRARYSLNIFF